MSCIETIVNARSPRHCRRLLFFILLSHFSITVDTIHWWILRVFYHVLLSCQYLFDGMYFSPFHQQFIGKIFIAKAMHIRNSITYKFISFRIIKKQVHLHISSARLFQKTCSTFPFYREKWDGKLSVYHELQHGGILAYLLQTLHKRGVCSRLLHIAIKLHPHQ